MANADVVKASPQDCVVNLDDASKFPTPQQFQQRETSRGAEDTDVNGNDVDPKKVAVVPLATSGGSPVQDEIPAPVIDTKPISVEIQGDTAPPSDKEKEVPLAEGDIADGPTLTGLRLITCRQWFHYGWSRSKEHLISVSMISGYLIIFYLCFLWTLPPWTVFCGLLCVWIGITFFMEGFMSGIMPLAELLGQGIADGFNLPASMFTTFLLGIACTLAEPAMGALEFAGSMVEVEKAPILWYLLSKWNFYVFLSVGLGVGFAALFGTLRLMRGWSLKLFIFLATFKTLGMTILADRLGLVEVVGLAWDAGAVTTGAVTVPIILGLGVGILAKDRERRGDNSEGNALDSFGIVTLASLYPVIFVLCLGILCDNTVSKAEILEYAASIKAAKLVEAEESPLDKSPLLEFIYASRAVLPLIALVVGILKIVMRLRLPYILLDVKGVNYAKVGMVGTESKYALCHLPEPGFVRLHAFVGVFQAYLGLIIFNIGLRHGQNPLGDSVGAAVPGLYTKVEGIEASPGFESRGVGYVVVCLFTFFMAFTATYAEPALNAMGMTTEQLTKGSFKKSQLLFAVAAGVGAGVMLGVCRMIFEWSLTSMLCVTYPIALLLSLISNIEYVAVGWDCAGVTTSSITVPLVLAMGIGCGTELGVQDSFGLLACGSIGPIISVLIAGQLTRLWAMYKNRNADPAAPAAPAAPVAPAA